MQTNPALLIDLDGDIRPDFVLNSIADLPRHWAELEAVPRSL